MTLTRHEALVTLPAGRRVLGDLARQFTLFLAILISGGLLIFPRLPIMLLILGLCPFLRGFKLELRRELVPVLVLVGAMAIVTLLRPGEIDFESLSIRLANFFTGFALITLYLALGTDSLARDLYRILGWMAIQALATVAAALVAPFLFMSLEIQETTYRTALLVLNYHVMVEDVGLLARPDGFFYEPGVFQIYLNLYLYLALFVFRNMRRSLLALAAVLSTQSTTGLLIALLLMGGYALGELQRVAPRRKVLIVIAAVIVAAPIALFAYQNAMQKLFGDLRGSSWARTYDLITGLNVLAAHPWVGIGFNHEHYKEVAATLGYADTQLSQEQTVDRSNSNGVVFLLYSIGIPLSLPFFIGMFRQRFFRHRLLIGLLLLLSFLSESIILTPFFLMLIFSGLSLRQPRMVPADVARTVPVS